MKNCQLFIITLMITCLSLSHLHAKLYEGGENLDSGDMVLSFGGSVDSSAIGASLKLAYGINDTMSAGINVSTVLLLNTVTLEYRAKLAGNQTHHFNAKFEIIYHQLIWTGYLHQLSIEPSLQYLFKAHDRIGLGIDIGLLAPLAYNHSDEDQMFPRMLSTLPNLNIRLWNQNSLHIALGPALYLRRFLQTSRKHTLFGKIMLSILF